MSPTHAPSPSPKHPDSATAFKPIVVISVSLCAPGGTDGLHALWDTLVQHKSHDACLAMDLRFLCRFDPDDFAVMFAVTPDTCTTLHGNLLDDTLPLDEPYFGIGKCESVCMDVQQKLLHIAHKALKDAGFSSATDCSTLDPATSGIYVGSATDKFFKDPNSFLIDIYHLIRSQCASAEHCVSNPIACVTMPWGSMSLFATEKCVDRLSMSSYM